MAKSGIVLIRVGTEGHAAKMLYDTGRWQRVAVPIRAGEKCQQGVGPSIERRGH